MGDVYRGRGIKKDHKNMLEVLDKVFFSDRDLTFLKLLPKLYKNKYDPALNNFIVKENDEIMAAVGLYYNQLHINDEILSFGGIGNVAVSKKARSKGYMKDCMNMAVQDMFEKGVDFAELGGQRQRYQYFSFESCGDNLICSLYIGNFYHTYGKDVKTDFKLKKIKSSDHEMIEQIYQLHRQGSYYVDRPIDKLHDIMCSWRNVPYALTLDGVFKGYIVLDRDFLYVQELKVIDKNDIKDCLLSLFDLSKKETVKVKLMRQDTDYINYCTSLCESVSSQVTGNYAIYNFEKVVREFLKLKASYQRLCDGSIVADINGYAKQEVIEITVKDNKVSVFSTNKKADISFEYFDSVRFFFGYSDKKNDVSPEVASWFPLPLDICSADKV